MKGHSKKLFLSAVSSEFASCRQLLTDDLRRPNLDVAVQEDIEKVVTGGTMLEKLDAYIRHCDGVIHLIGKAAGALPREAAVAALLAVYPDFSQRLPALADALRLPQPGFSYTQWEAYLAIYHRRPLFVYRPTDFELDALQVPRDARFVFNADEAQAQKEHYRRISALGKDRGQFTNEERLSSAVLRDLVEILPRLESRIDVPPTKLRHTAQRLIGRDAELTLLDEAWNDPHRNVVVVRGKGGEGKTSLVATWMAELATKDWRGAEWVLDWSFYSQGTRDQGTASGEAFIISALGHFGDPQPNKGGPEERGARLARLVGARRGLLVLDGLEPLQYPPGPMHGQLTDKGVAALLKGLAGQNAGLCVVTTRERVDEIQQHYGRSAIDYPLEFLSPAAGAALLHYSGAQRAGAKAIAADDRELQQASREVQGHALTLFLIGQYLRLTEHGNIRRRDCLKLAEAEAEYKNDATRPYGHAFKAIEAYERWFAAGDDQAKRQLAILRLLGLFDRPASRDCLTALRAAPAIPGLNEALAGGADREWNIALNRLGEINLVGVKEDDSVDCHPLLREYFAVQLKTKAPAAWKAGHQRLYEHLCANTHEGEAPTLEDLQPLYQAVAHGCQAGLQQKVCEDLYYTRITRGEKKYPMRKLGAFGSELRAVACFFDSPWSRVSSTFDEAGQAWLLNQAAFRLRALGRLTEALEPMRAGLEMRIKQRVWKSAAIIAGNLSELEQTLGEVALAERDAAQSVTYADRSGDFHQRQETRCTLADALNQASNQPEAEARFREAEEIHAKGQPGTPLLYSIRGFRYCDLLLTEAERAAWQLTLSLNPRLSIPNLSDSCRAVSQRAAQTVEWVEAARVDILSIALDHLTLGRAAFYATILCQSESREPKSEIEQAVTGLRQAGQQDELPRALLTRAWLRFREGKPTGSESAQSDLDEAWEIAERGPMRLFLTDIHLHRARLFFREKHYPWESPQADLAAAEKLINDCGYHRRDEELADAKAAIL